MDRRGQILPPRRLDVLLQKVLQTGLVFSVTDAILQKKIASNQKWPSAQKSVKFKYRRGLQMQSWMRQIVQVLLPGPVVSMGFPQAVRLPKLQSLQSWVAGCDMI